MLPVNWRENGVRGSGRWNGLQTSLSINGAGLKQLEAHLQARQELEAEYGVLRKVERAAARKQQPEAGTGTVCPVGVF